MVELSGKDDPFQHGFPNVVFVLPAIIVAGLSGEYDSCLHRAPSYANARPSEKQKYFKSKANRSDYRS